MNNRQDYFDLMLEYASKSSKFDSVVNKKAEIVEQAVSELGISMGTVLSVGLSAAAIGLHKAGYDVQIVDGGSNLHSAGDEIPFHERPLTELDQKYDIVLALDEYTTYAASEDEQKGVVNALCKVVGNTLITTIRDYKNMPQYRRNFEEPFNFFMDDNTSCLFLEQSIWNRQYKQEWDHYLYAIEDFNTLKTVGPIKRHTMYFKQLAKFTKDEGAVDFIVHRNLLYKGIFKKSYEHVVTIQF